MIVFGIVIVVLFLIVRASMNGKKILATLKADYDLALQSGDKARALQAGRAYYSKMRNGKLTIYDEQAITNDLSTMK